MHGTYSSVHIALTTYARHFAYESTHPAPFYILHSAYESTHSCWCILHHTCYATLYFTVQCYATLCCRCFVMITALRILHCTYYSTQTGLHTQFILLHILFFSDSTKRNSLCYTHYTLPYTLYKTCCTHCTILYIYQVLTILRIISIVRTIQDVFVIDHIVHNTWYELYCTYCITNTTPYYTHFLNVILLFLVLSDMWPCC